MKATSFSDSSFGSDGSDRHPLSIGDGSLPSDPSLARQTWEEEKGMCPPAGPHRPHPEGKSEGSTCSPARQADPFELITLPFSEYSAVFPDRMSNLQVRLCASTKKPTFRFLIVDVSRIQYPSALLIDMLRWAAAILIRDGRCLVLIGNLHGLVTRSGLAELCLTVDSLEAAKTLCRKGEDS